MKLLLLGLVVLLSACVPSPASPVLDAGDAASPITTPHDAASAPSGDLATEACANMAQWCAEGRAPNCAFELRALAAANLTPISLSCLATANGAPRVRTCGNVRCTTP